MEQQVETLKHVPMARRATAKEAMEAVEDFLRIDESKAESHLNHGYELVTVLPSGKLLIRKKKH